LVDHSAIDKAGVGTHVGPAPLKKPGFLQRIPTWNRHKYAQIDEQTAVHTAMKGKVYNTNDADVLLTRGFGGGEDEEDEEHELVRESARGIQLQPMGNGPSRDIDTAYDPYRSQTGAA